MDIKDDPDKLLKLYEITINEEHYFLKEHQSRIAFFTSIISALIGGTLYGMTQITEWYHAIAFIVVPVMIFVVSSLAIASSMRFYQRFLEAIITKAKTDQRLELTKSHWSNMGFKGTYWQDEPLIPPRHLKDRKKHKSSLKFFNEFKHRGYQKWVKLLFQTFQCLSVALMVGLILLALTYYNGA